jgi:hypothetical protein
VLFHLSKPRFHLHLLEQRYEEEYPTLFDIPRT